MRPAAPAAISTAVVAPGSRDVIPAVKVEDGLCATAIANVSVEGTADLAAHNG
jgi:hypothetical protein